MATKIAVRGFTSEVTSQELDVLFSGFGEVLSVVIENAHHNMPLMAFVEMQNSDEALKALTVLKNKLFQGNRLQVSQARPLQDNGPDGAKYRLL